MVLTGKQREDLHQAILEYLSGLGSTFAQSATAFQQDAGLTMTGESDPTKTGLLEKKWTSVVRLQRKVMELESKIQQLEEDAKLGGIVSRRDVTGVTRDAALLPRAPPKYSMSGHRSPITSVVFHPVFSVVVTSSEDATVKVWDFETGEFERTLKGHTNAVQNVAFNPAGTLLASSSADLTIKLWDFSSDGSYECKKTLRGHDHNVCGLVFSPSGDHIVSCSRDTTIKIWEVETGYCTHTLKGHSDWVRDVCVSEDGLYLASGGNDRTITLWDLQQAKAIQWMREHEHVVETVQFAKGIQQTAIEAIHGKKVAETTGQTFTRYLLSGSRDRTVRLWEAFSGLLLMNFVSHDNWVRSVRFHLSGKYAISASEDKTIRVFDIETGRCVRTLKDAHNHFLTTLDVHPTLPLIVTGSIDKFVNVWECV
ncbi:unnamed protein product [Aphanomyces euteiches]|uniref:Lissencephaly-1 homolog n=1 Tax=Aphanomyces euteiches TaxID=100861 RepID=A0A6G0WZI9_9STRA|nr:hypothetical protein Ae201684_010043 [Aphanomyces euteiches]KAH9099651.1 hypothetical protein Ae201684P_018664 [Aphanomyces euteiches]KAH9104434.1 hypothetical protein LEN26_015038 [Aphanomyces euteiches]KAH9145612.1 hypothetical protein AeRB84_010477 [Aphanomyces euteiches]KAH9192658.1 hypothetical protein AeNC1_005358 [Aphanomyces euteiches]